MAAVAGLGLLAMDFAVQRFVSAHIESRLDAQVLDTAQRFAAPRFRRLPTDGAGEIDPSGIGAGGIGAGGAVDPRVAAGTTGTSLPGSTDTAALDEEGVANSPPGRIARRPPLLPGGVVYFEFRDERGIVIGYPTSLSLLRSTVVQLDLPQVLPAATARGTFFDVRSQGDETVFRAVHLTLNTPNRNITILAALPRSEVDDTLERLLVILVGSTLAVLATLAAAGWLLLRFGLRPLQRIEDAAVTIANGDLSHRVELLANSSEFGRLADSLNTMMGRIEHAFSERDDTEARLRRFAADASHELRTPLAAIRGHAQFHQISRRGRDPETDAAMARVDEAGVRMQRIVEDLLALAKADAGTLNVAPLPLDIADAVRQVVAEARVVRPERRVDVVVTESACILADAVRLHQAISNVVDNSLGHTSGAVRVCVNTAERPAEVSEESASTSAATVSIEVSDDGPGVNESHLGRLFEPFYRVDQGRSRERGGSGLGLAITAEIVRSFAGSISVTSSPKAGTTVIMRFPVGVSVET